MSDPQRELRVWLQDQLAERGHGAKGALAKRLGVAPGVVSRMLNLDPSKESRQILAHEIDVIRDFFGGELGPLAQPAEAPSEMATQSSRVREIDIRAGAGGGGVEGSLTVTRHGRVTISADVVAANWEMPVAFLRGELKVNPANAWVVEVMGDSGYDPAHPSAPGSLFPGDRAIIDTGDRRPSPPGPFAVFDGMGLVIKLVEPVHGSDPPRLRLSSRNPRYTDYEVTSEEAHIIGRVRGRISAM